MFLTVGQQQRSSVALRFKMYRALIDTQYVLLDTLVVGLNVHMGFVDKNKNIVIL